MNKKISVYFVLLLLLLGIGTMGYSILEGWEIFDSFYMTIITVSTVGFSEVQDLTTEGRIFTIFMIMAGIGVMTTGATQVAGFIIDRELSGVFGGKNKMQKQLKVISNHYVICGFGRTGAAICRKLHEEKIPFVVTESDEDRIAEAERRHYLAVAGDATRDTTLITAGTCRAVGLVSCLNSDADNLYVTLAARELNKKIHIIARGEDPEAEDRIERAGADTVVFPMTMGGEQIARLVAHNMGRELRSDEGMHEPEVQGYFLRIYPLL